MPRTGLTVSARVALVALGSLVILIGLFARGIILESAEYVGERLTNPDGTVTYWDPEGATDENYDVRAEDGSVYSGSGPAFVWIIGRGGEGIEAVFEGRTPAEAEAYVVSHRETLFTGSPAEAAAWATNQRDQQRSLASLLLTLGLIVGGSSIVVGLWPGRRGSSDTSLPAPTRA